MIAKKFGRKKKAANNEGRTTKVTSIMISQNLKEKLSELKDAYGAFYDDTVTYDQMLERWASQVKRFDPQVFAYLKDMRKKRMQVQEEMAEGMGITAKQLEENRASFDPTSPENEPWKLRYFFEKDGDEYEAHPDTERLFCTTYDGKIKGFDEMLYLGFELMNEAGIEISPEDARKLCEILLRKKEESESFKAPERSDNADEEEELDAWFISQEQMGFDDDLDYEKLFRRFELRNEDEKYRTKGKYGFGMEVGDHNKMQLLYDFDEEANTPEEKEKAARLLTTYRRRLDAELDAKLKVEQEEEERKLAEERRREEERIAEAKAPYRMSEADREAYDRYQDEAGQKQLNKRVAALLKDLPNKEQIIIDGMGLWASDGELIFPVRKDGRFKKVTNWDGAVKQPETYNYKLLIK